MNKVLIVIMFILLGTSLIVVANMGKEVQNSFVVEYHNNKNLAFPELQGKEEINVGYYRLINEYNFTVDYNLFTGVWVINGQASQNTILYQYIYDLDETYNASYYYISGAISNNNLIMGFYDNNGSGVGEYNSINSDTYKNNQNAVSNYGSNNIILISINGSIYNNFTFKMQLQKGPQATSYMVPKLIPVYKDNLTQQEKNEIGIGAFGGISKIIKTISDIIKPVGDFINGLLSLF